MRNSNMEKGKLRRVNFRPYRKGLGPTFRLITWDTGRTDRDGKTILKYRLLMKEDGKRAKLIFEGSDFCCSPLCSIDGNETLAALMGFLTLRPGDTDREYFDSYTPRQMAYCSEHAETLNCYASWKLGQE